jgi:hypothetical protein
MSDHWKCHECGRETSSDSCYPCPGPPARLRDVEEMIDARLRRIAERLRVPHGGLVPDAEVYVRAALAKVFEEELEGR